MFSVVELGEKEHSITWLFSLPNPKLITVSQSSLYAKEFRASYNALLVLDAFMLT